MVGDCLFESAAVFELAIRIVVAGTVAESFAESVVEFFLESLVEFFVESAVELVVESSMLSDLRTDEVNRVPFWFL